MFKPLVLLSLLAAASAQLDVLPYFPSDCADKCKIAEQFRPNCAELNNNCLGALCTDLIKLKPCFDCAKIDGFWESIQVTCRVIGSPGSDGGGNPDGKSDDGKSGGGGNDDKVDDGVKDGNGGSTSSPQLPPDVSGSGTLSGEPFPMPSETVTDVGTASPAPASTGPATGSGKGSPADAPTSAAASGSGTVGSATAKPSGPAVAEDKAASGANAFAGSVVGLGAAVMLAALV